MAFQLFIIYTTIYVHRHELYVDGLHASKQYKNLYTGSLVILVLGVIWLYMMGYAITTRQEPRWAESILYNLYFFTLLIILLSIALKFGKSLYRNISVTSDNIHIDDYDLTTVLGPINLCIVKIMIQNEGCKANCEELTLNCLPGNGKNHCDTCAGKFGKKVSLCPKYKNIYNRILEIKKLFESLEIGTVIAPENKMKVLTEGWKLRFFDDIRVHVNIRKL